MGKQVKDDTVNRKIGYTFYKDKYFKKGNELINIKHCTSRGGALV